MRGVRRGQDLGTGHEARLGQPVVNVGGRELHSLVVMVALAGTLAAVSSAGAGHPSTTSALQTIDASRLKSALDRGRRLVVIDLRSSEEFRRGHIPGARSLPLDEAAEKFRDLPRREAIVLYCDCALSELASAYQFLRLSGYANVFVLEGGVADWLTRGYPIEK